MSVFKRRRFPAEIILLCVRWYCKYGMKGSPSGGMSGFIEATDTPGGLLTPIGNQLAGDRHHQFLRTAARSRLSGRLSHKRPISVKNSALGR